MIDANFSEPGLDPSTASEYLRDRHGIRHGVATLAKLRSNGRGPKYRKRGKYIDYAPTRLDEYARSKISGEISSTSEAA